MNATQSVTDGIPTGHFRLARAKSGGSVRIDDFEAPETAFAAAKARNDAIGVDGAFREPYIVFSWRGLIVFGPADGWSENQMV